MICVIGSGPAGVAAAFPLAKAGRQVLMLDVGGELEPERRTMVSRMAAMDKTLWSKDDLRELRRGMNATRDGVALKHVYGSDFPYRHAGEGIDLQRRNAGVMPSFALGGLSNAWGGAILPDCEKDLANWPITLGELVPHYRALHEFMPLSGGKDNLERSFPLHGIPLELPLSRQAADLLEDLRKRRIHGLSFGQSRLALNSGCVSCGLCLYGCPYGLIYNSAETVAYLRTLPNFSYQPATVVRRIEEKGGKVVVHGDNSDGTFSITADTLFLAAGTLATTRIMLESLEASDHPLQLLSSQYFLFPLLRPRQSAGASKEELHTLSQLFLEICDPLLSPFTIHLQCYSYNDLYRQAAAALLGPLVRLLPLDMVLERLILVQGYLHSDSSPPMRLTLTQGRLELEGQTDKRIAAIIRKLMNKLRPVGYPFSPKIGIPGEGFHSGGSLPMRKSPAPFETDIWGRPYGFDHVHIVDASVMPSIPATTITYTAMANAHRIASEYRHSAGRTTRGRRCAITGANGYVGVVIADYLRSQGYEVIPLVRRPAGPGRKFSLEDQVDPAILKDVDCLVHAAYDFSLDSPDTTQKANIDGSRRIFAAAGEAGVGRMVYISTLSAFAGCRSDYGRIKLEIEGIARLYGAVVLRPGLVYGPQPGGMVGALRQLATRKVIPLVGGGEQLLYMTHQEDLGRIVYQLLLMEAMPDVPVVAAAAEPITMKEIITLLARTKPIFVPLPGRLLLRALQLGETLGYSSRLRSDSLLNLLSPPPAPDFSSRKATGVTFRSFAQDTPAE